MRPSEDGLPLIQSVVDLALTVFFESRQVLCEP
jgi:hypothetical protein